MLYLFFASICQETPATTTQKSVSEKGEAADCPAEQRVEQRAVCVRQAAVAADALPQGRGTIYLVGDSTMDNKYWLGLFPSEQACNGYERCLEHRLAIALSLEALLDLLGGQLGRLHALFGILRLLLAASELRP